MRANAARARGGARTALIHAFNRIFLQQRERMPRVSEVAQQAGVSRSTFYDHYAGMDDLHMRALSRPFAALADAIAGSRNAAKLEHVLLHFWENRDRARSTLGGETRDKVERLLATMILERLPHCAATSAVPLRLAAVQLAGAQLTLLRAWLAGESHCSAADLAQSIYVTSTYLRASLFPARACGVRVLGGS
jgi:AcrR family transcriptional regulator